MNKPIYLDYAATTPVHPTVLEHMLPYLQGKFGNAGSEQHLYGWEAEEAIVEARTSIAHYFGGKAKQVIFTSGATESNNLAIQGFLKQFEKPGHIISSKIEHKAVLEVCKYLESTGWQVTYLSPNTLGEITAQQVVEAIRPETKLVSLMWVNNELGSILPIDEILLICKAHQIIFHSDATQALGKIDLQNRSLPDMITFSGHKMYGPKGIGGLYLTNTSISLQPLVFGGNQERGLRSGTLPTHQIVGLASAFKLLPEMLEKASFYEFWKQKMIKMLQQHFESHLILHTSQSVVPQILNFSLKGVDGENLFEILSDLALSNGSACNAKTKNPSYVIKALGCSDAEAFATIRLSMGWMNTAEEMEYALGYLEEKLKQVYERVG